ncbi:MAG TPA: hypothetical protein VGD42_19475 [Lysobacter sp.]
MRTRIDLPPNAGNTLRHRQPLHDELALLFAEFEARGGAVQRLPQGALGNPGRSYYNDRMVGPARPQRRAAR